MNKEESIALYEKGTEAWNIWANVMLAKKTALEENKQWQIKEFEGETNQVTKNWIAESRIDFSTHIFTESVNFSNFIFPGSVNFSSTKFDDDVAFDRATFNDKVEFYNATFSGDCDYQGKLSV